MPMWRRDRALTEMDPNGQYATGGLSVLRALVEYYEQIADSRFIGFGYESFLDQVVLAGKCRIDSNHDEWLELIRRGAAIFEVTDYERVQLVLGKINLEGGSEGDTSYVSANIGRQRGEFDDPVMNAANNEGPFAGVDTYELLAGALPKKPNWTGDPMNGPPGEPPVPSSANQKTS